jgi:hypothetical protein
LICGDHKYVSAISDQQFKDLHLHQEQIRFLDQAAAWVEWSAFKKTGCEGKFFVPRPYRKLTDNQKLDD